MKKIYFLLITGLIAAALLFASIMPAAANFPRYANLNLAPIPVQSDSKNGEGFEKLERCSARIGSSDNQLLTPLLDGTGIFQDFNLNKITQIQPSHRGPIAQIPYSSKAADQTICTFSALQTAG
jgi:hypothetical protein